MKWLNLFRFCVIVVNILVIILSTVLLYTTLNIYKSTVFVRGITLVTFPSGGTVPSPLFYSFLLYMIIPLCSVGCVAVFLKSQTSRVFVRSFYIFQFTLGIALFSMTDHSENRFEMEVDLIESIFQYNVKNNKDNAALLDMTHRKLKCCGFDDYLDWFVTPNGERTDVPDSCCLIPKPRCGKNASKQEGIEKKLFPRGCFQVIINELDRIRLIYLSIVFIILSVPLVVFFRNNVHSWMETKRRQRQ